jgi:hypothetical protein
VNLRLRIILEELLAIAMEFDMVVEQACGICSAEGRVDREGGGTLYLAHELSSIEGMATNRSHRVYSVVEAGGRE